MRRSTLAVIAGLAAVGALALALPIIGVFAGPVAARFLPRPAIVPANAVAYSDWEGFGGVAWEWCARSPRGRVFWNSVDWGRKILVGLALDRDCPKLPKSNSPFDDPHDVYFWTDEPTISFNPDRVMFTTSGAGVPCPYSISTARLSAYAALAAEARGSTKNTAQAAALSRFIEQLRNTDGSALTTDAADMGGCTNGPRWRAPKS